MPVKWQTTQSLNIPVLPYSFFSAELAHEKDDIIKSWDSLVETASRYAGYKRTNYGPDFVIRMNQHWDEVSENINNL